MIAVYPGTFDPLTLGHLNLIKRSSKIFETLIVAIANDTEKNSAFSMDERVAMAKIATKDLKNVKIIAFSGLLVNFVSQQKATVIVRGIRAVSDFEYEFQMSCVNFKLNENIETIFLPAQDNMHFISSRFVRTVARLGGDISKFVPLSIIDIVYKKFIQ